MKIDLLSPGSFADGQPHEQYRWLRSYSPLHNVRPDTAYPPTLLVTGDHDDRVVPGHTFKFAATLQAAQSGAAPILVRVDTAAGHGQGGCDIHLSLGPARQQRLMIGLRVEIGQ